MLAVNPQPLCCQTLNYLNVTHTLIGFPQKGFLQDAPIVIHGQDVGLTYLLMVVTQWCFSVPLATLQTSCHTCYRLVTPEAILELIEQEQDVFHKLACTTIWVCRLGCTDYIYTL